MGTPHLFPEEAIDLYAKLGYEAIEFLCLEDYRCGVSPTASRSWQLELSKRIRDRGLEAACLTPYVTDLNHPDPEECRKQKDMLKGVIEIAARIGFQFVRVFGGRLVEPKYRRESFDRQVAALRECAPVAKDHRVVLVIENHYNTLTVTAAETVAIIQAVDHPNVRIIYDQSNITQMRGEDYTEAIDIQKDYIAHVHLKDIEFKKGAVQQATGVVDHFDPSQRAVFSRVIGKGIILWPDIIQRLHEIGYDGCLSVEYGSKWYPEDLPAPEEGLRESVEYIRKCLKDLK